MLPEVKAALLELAPAGVHWSAERELEQISPFDDEINFIRDACAARKTEYFLGRQCARAALSELGVPYRSIPTGSDGEPIWPPKIVGSISHSGGVAVSVVAFSSRYSSLGIDIETEDGLPRELEGLILSKREVAILPNNELRAQQAIAFFSAKEAVIKCLWPICRRKFSFQDIDIAFSEGGTEFTANSSDWISASCRNIRGYSYCGLMTINLAVMLHPKGSAVAR